MTIFMIMKIAERHGVTYMDVWHTVAAISHSFHVSYIGITKRSPYPLQCVNIIYYQAYLNRFLACCGNLKTRMKRQTYD